MGMLGTSYTYDQGSVTLAEGVVLKSLAQTENVGAQDQAGIVILCRRMFERGEANRKKYDKLYRYYNDDQKKLFVDDVLRPMMGTDADGQSVYDRMCRENVCPQIKIVNLVKRFVDKQSTLYDEPAEREIEGNPAATEKYNEIARDLKLDAVMQMAERYQKLLRSAFIRPLIRRVDGKDVLDLDLMLPTFFYAIPNPQDSTRAKGYFWLVYDQLQPDDPHKATWYYIDKDNYFWFVWKPRQKTAGTAGGDLTAYITELYKEDDVERPEGNPLQETGIVRVATDWVCGDVIPAPGDSIINFQDGLNLVETLKQNSLVFQGFPILHLKNFDTKDKDGNIRRLNIGPGSALVSQDVAGDVESKVEWIAPATNIEQFTKSVEHDIDYFMLSMGVPKNLILDAATSGTALAERNRDIKEVRKSYINQYRGAEREIYRIIAKWANTWLGGGLPEDAVLNVKYHEPGMKFESETEELNAWKLKLELGLATKRDYLAEKYPGISEEELDKKLVEIKADEPRSVFRGFDITGAVNRGLENEKRPFEKPVQA
jgi:hypothetical protein